MVGVFVDIGFLQPIEVAYNVDTKRVVPFSTAEGTLRASIIQTYDVRPDELMEAEETFLRGPHIPETGNYIAASANSVTTFRIDHREGVQIPGILISRVYSPVSRDAATTQRAGTAAATYKNGRSR